MNGRNITYEAIERLSKDAVSKLWIKCKVTLTALGELGHISPINGHTIVFAFCGI